MVKRSRNISNDDGRKESTRFQYGFSDLFGKTEKVHIFAPTRKDLRNMKS